MGMENLLNYYFIMKKTICDRSFGLFFGRRTFCTTALV